MRSTYSKSNQFPMKKIKSHPTFFLVRVAFSLGKDHYNFFFMLTLNMPFVLFTLVMPLINSHTLIYNAQHVTSSLIRVGCPWLPCSL